MASRLTAPVLCSRCAQPARRLFTLGSRYVCAEDACLDAVLRDLRPDDPPDLRARLRADLQRAFKET